MILSGRIPWIEGFNDLATTHPELTKEWDYEKNGKLTPLNVVEFSNKKYGGFVTKVIVGMLLYVAEHRKKVVVLIVVVDCQSKERRI